MSESYKDILTIKTHKTSDKKNLIDIWVKWDCNDGDYIERLWSSLPEYIFNNKKLIYCLAYITCSYKFKGHGWNDNVFQHHIISNKDIIDLEEIISENGYMAYTDWGPCHSLIDLKIVYYDENGTPFDITFEDIHKRWKNMSYQEICDEINNIIKDDKE